MYQEKKYKLARRLGAGVFEKAQTPKFAASQARRGKQEGSGKRPTDYGLQLIEKQRVRVMYGVLERQFRNYVRASLETATPAMTLFELLETRLDNVICRLGFAPTRRMARQMVAHGHIMVNGSRTKVPSHAVHLNDVITVREGSKKNSIFSNAEAMTRSSIVPWLSMDIQQLRAVVKGRPADPDPFLNFQSVIEFYSR
jgi:small subunit ribosomal protein S4